MFFPIKLKGHLRLMESDFEPTHDTPEIEPVLEVVEGDASKQEADRSIVPNAFESVLAQYEEHPKELDKEAPPYKNRAFIAVLCLVAGIFAGRLTTQPKIETRVIEKEKPVLVASNPTTPEAPKVDNPFRELNNLKDFDPWQPMNGGFPLPPKQTQANIVSRSGGPSNYTPPPLGGRIEPMDPGDIGMGPLPDVGTKGAPNLPDNPLPGGGDANTSKGEAKIVDGGKPAVASGKERYVSMSMNGPDPVKGQNSIASIASAMGGVARTYSHMAEDGTLESQGVLIIIPAAKYEEAKGKIEALGGASVEGNYEGLASEQSSRIQGMFSVRLAKLKEKKKDLLVDFLDDAQPVKQINEAIDLETRAVSATHLPSGLAGKVVIRVQLK